MRYSFRSLSLYLVFFVLLQTLSSCGGRYDATNTGSASFGLRFEQASAPAAMKPAPSMAPADICSSYGIDTISGTVYNSSNTVIATGGPWACSAHQGTIYNIPQGSNLRIAIKGTVSGSSVWQGEVTGVTIYVGQDTNVGSIAMTYTGNDTTPPTVSAATPTGSNVPVTSPITVTFSESMASSTIDTSTFTLRNGSLAVTGSVSYNASTRTSTFTPASSLSYSSTYTATVTTSVTDMAANHMQSPYAWSFTTEAAQGSAPTAPPVVNATAADKQVTISWTAASGATSYNIYWSPTAGVTKSTGTPITGATSPYIHTGLTNGTTYYYVVAAVNSFGESAASTQVSATPQVPAPSAPTGVSATAGNAQVTISWTAVTGATSYNVYYSSTAGVTTGNGTKVANATSGSAITGLTSGTTYYFIATAVNPGGESSASAPVSDIPRSVGRYTDGTGTNGGIVIDNITNLMWQKCPPGSSGASCAPGTAVYYNWTNAITYCTGLSLTGFTDWRLPDITELTSLVVSGNNPSIDPLFPNTQSWYYWSSTGVASDTTYAWSVNFNTGATYGSETLYNLKTNLNCFRCVR